MKFDDNAKIVYKYFVQTIRVIKNLIRKYKEKSSEKDGLKRVRFVTMIVNSLIVRVLRNDVS